MRVFLRRVYDQNRDWSVFRGLRFMRNSVRAASNRARAALRIPREREFLRWCCDPVFQTSPMASDPSAPAEIHTLVCSRHLSMYLTAVNSLLRLVGGFAVTAHDDGSLTCADRSLLEAHIDGIRIIPKAAADREMAVLLKNHPRSLEFRKKTIVSFQLFDFAHFSKTNKVFALDSDTLFMKKPQALIDWAAGADPQILHMYERCP